MPSERIQRRIDRLLDEIEAAQEKAAWSEVRERAAEVLDLDPENLDAAAFLRAAERRAIGGQSAGSEAPSLAEPVPLPESFAGGRYRVQSFLGEGGRKRVYLAHDTRLDREVALAVIKAEGLDLAGRTRVQTRRGPWPVSATIRTSPPSSTSATTIHDHTSFRSTWAAARSRT